MWFDGVMVWFDGVVGCDGVWWGVVVRCVVVVLW